MTQGIIKFLTAGNVDDGKSTLIGRLLFDTNSLYKDQIEEVTKSTAESFKGDIDFSLFLDGLTSERAQKITIDVAYRYFSYNGRKCIIADAPGHEQYTKNMAVAAANANIAVLLIDAKKGIKRQTIRHSYIANLFGIKDVIVAVNKMDAMDFDQNVFEEIKNEYKSRIGNLKFDSVNFVPISAIAGDNILNKSDRCPWYKGETIVEYLLAINTKQDNQDAVRLQVQNIIKHESKKEEKRYYQGILSNGNLAVGDEVNLYPAKKSAKITQIIHSSKEVKKASQGNSLMVAIDQDIDLDRGGLMTDLNNKPHFANNLSAYLVWFSEDEFDIKNPKEYLIKINHNTLRAGIDNISHLINVDDLKEDNHETIHHHIAQNQIAYVDLSLSKKVPFDSFSVNKKTGSFLLIDRNSNETLACGIISNFTDRAVKAKRKRGFLAKLFLLIKEDLFGIKDL